MATAFDHRQRPGGPGGQAQWKTGSTPSPRHAGASFFGVLAVVVALGVLFVIQRTGKKADVNQDQLGPVLLVPGYGGSTGSPAAPRYRRPQADAAAGRGEDSFDIADRTST